jgi:hypothetical protein
LRRADEDLGPRPVDAPARKAATEPVSECIFGIDALDSFRTLCATTWGVRMPRFKVVATVVLALALALMAAGCSDSTDSPEPSKAAGRQLKLEQAHNDGINAHKSMNKFGFEATQGECKAHYAATEANDLGSDAMVDLGRRYFVAGCMEGLAPTEVAQEP